MVSLYGAEAELQDPAGTTVAVGRGAIHAHAIEAQGLQLLQIGPRIAADSRGCSTSIEPVSPRGLLGPCVCCSSSRRSVMPLGFFLSTASPRTEKPNLLISLVPLGGVLLSAGV